MAESKWTLKLAENSWLGRDRSIRKIDRIQLPDQDRKGVKLTGTGSQGQRVR